MSNKHSSLALSIFPRLDCARYRQSGEHRDQVVRLVEKGVGGFVLFDGDLQMVADVIAELQTLSGNRLLFAADCEHGVTMRFTGGTAFPSMMTLGRANDVAATYAVARGIAREMRAIGIHWNFAPVADINSNPENPIINIRSFGETPELVAEHVHAYMRGLQDGGVAACLKHFPGHGDTAVDSHLELPTISRSLEALRERELKPFKKGIDAGVRSVMIGHIALPALDPSGEAATLSEAIVDGLLRKDLGFDGVVVTDAMEMHAITKRYSSAEAATRAFCAGVDVIELPEEPEEALRGLLDAAERGDIPEERIARSAARIQALKTWCDSYAGGKETIERSIDGHDVIALEAARRGMSVEGHLRKLYAPLFVVAFVDEGGNDAIEEWFQYFSAWYQGEATGAVVTPDLTSEDAAEIIASAEGAGTVIVALSVRPRGAAGTIGLNEAQMEIIESVKRKPMIIMNFGNPYLLRDLEPAGRVDTYSPSSASLAASIEGLNRIAG
jgi:beta-N-acetylhexosaminidase